MTHISLWPGAAKTELVMENVHRMPAENMQKMFEHGESTEFSGVCIRALAADPNVLQKTGRVIITGDIGYEYGLTDVDGRTIPSLRMVYGLLSLTGHTWLAAIVPRFVRVPGCLLAAVTSKY